MSKRWAVIDATGIVDNVILWDGEVDYTAPDGFSLEVAAEHVGKGWRFDNGVWTPALREETIDA